MANSQPNFVCPICKRITPDYCIEKHHKIPKSKGGKETENVCCNCGDMVHKLISLKEMETTYNTIEAILSHPGIKEWVKWISKKPNDFSVCMRSKKRRR